MSILSRLKIHLLLGALALTTASVASAADQSVNFDSIAQRATPCMTCHGKEGRATNDGYNDGYYPRIAGKPAGYLYNQLVNFRDGRRQQYPLMIYMVQHLSDPYLQEIATISPISIRLFRHRKHSKFRSPYTEAIRRVRRAIRVLTACRRLEMC